MAPNAWRGDFPIFEQTVYGKPFIYLDSAATTLKPNIVIDRIQRYYANESVNVHRGLYKFSEMITTEFEQVREKVKTFINATESAEVVFTSGTTDSINLVAQSFGNEILKSGDEVLVTGLEHHANIVSWQLVCERMGCHLKVVPVLDSGELDLKALPDLLTGKTKIFAFGYVSNALGTINPVKNLINIAREKGIFTLVDAAQAMAHMPVDVRDLGCDFLAFSAHKMFGPTGLGVLYGRKELLQKMRPIKGGGDMIRSVSFAKTTYADVPHIFEAGTPHIAGVLGLGAAIEYIHSLNFTDVHRHEQFLLEAAHEKLGKIENIRIIGTGAQKVPVVSFVIDGIHAHDLGAILDREGVAIRTGHHCAQPLMERMGVAATARASLSFYNDPEDIDVLVKGVQKAQELFA